MTSEDFSKFAIQLAENLAKELPTINEKAALNAYGMVKNRVINDGTIGENKSLGGYSDNPLPTFWFIGKSANKSGDKALAKALEKENGKEKGISYKRWREANNRPTDHKTLSFTGTTFNDIGVIKQLIDGTKVITIVGAKNTKNRENGKTTSEIMGYLGDQVGDFLSPNQAEVKLLENFYNKEIDKIIKRSIK